MNHVAEPIAKMQKLPKLLHRILVDSNVMHQMQRLNMFALTFRMQL
jgi:hypothetical protein